MKRHYVVRKGGSLLVRKSDNPSVGKSRTDRVREIFEVLKAPRNGNGGSGRRQVKYFHINSGRKVPNFDKRGRGDSETVEEAKDLRPVQPKERKVLSFEERRIRYGRSLMRKRKNGWYWNYDPGMEPDINVERFGEDEYDVDDEDINVDKVKDENGDEDDEEDWLDYVISGRRFYHPFDVSGRREYFLYLAEDGSFDEDYHKMLFQKALKCSKCDANNRVIDVVARCLNNGEILTVPLTEAEADDFAGLDEVCCVKPG